MTLAAHFDDAVRVTASTHRDIDQLRMSRLTGPQRLSLNARPEGVCHALYCVTGQPYVRTEAARFQLMAGEVGIVGSARSSSILLDREDELLLLRILPTTAGAFLPILHASHAHHWPTASGTPNLVGHLLHALHGQDTTYVPTDPARLAQHVVGLIALMCSDALGSSASGSPALLQRAKEYVERHLSDADLTPDRIASALHVSSRTLHRLYTADGHTPGSWIRMRRLERSRADLVDAHSDGVSVSAIGARWGLTDAAHFSRLFKSAFGVAPRAYRLAHRRQAIGTLR